MKILSTEQKNQILTSWSASAKEEGKNLEQQIARSLLQNIADDLSTFQQMVVLASVHTIGKIVIELSFLLCDAIETEIFYFDVEEKMNEEEKNHLTSLCETRHITLHIINKQFSIPQLSPQTIIIDALFDGSLRQPLRGGFADIVKLINASAAQIYAIECPSGLFDSDNSDNIWQHIVKANQTLTLFAPSLSLLLPDTQTFVGKLKICHIEDQEKHIEPITTPYHIVTEDMVRGKLRKRDPFAHKGNFGHALIIAGKKGMAGAGILAAKSCLKAGVGKVTVHSAAANNDIFQIAIPEAIFDADESREIFSKSVVQTHAYQAVAIGPGIGTAQNTAIAFLEQLRKDKLPTVIDADGLNILAHHRGWLQQLPKDSILTPHPGELLSMTDINLNSYQLLEKAEEMAHTLHIYVLLKGHYTAICTPDKKVFFNTTGNEGMATAGSGDVLTGIITALLAQQHSALTACLLGVYLHGKAGDWGKKEQGSYSLMASDIIAYLPKAFQQLV